MVKQRNDKKSFSFCRLAWLCNFVSNCHSSSKREAYVSFFLREQYVQAGSFEPKIDSLSFFLQVGLAVQFVSNCHSSSKREAYVRELRRFIPVDIYGKCGEFKCAKEKGWQCYKEAEVKYKFYLAFENAV